MKYHLFRSKNNPAHGITIGERDDGTYFLPSASEHIDPEHNVFVAISEIEELLNDRLEMLRPKDELC